jgi:hypothetical protein
VRSSVGCHDSSGVIARLQDLVRQRLNGTRHNVRDCVATAPVTERSFYFPEAEEKIVNGQTGAKMGRAAAG